MQAMKRRDAWSARIWVGVIVRVAVVVVAPAYLGANRMQAHWELFKVANECRVVAAVKGNVNVSPMAGATVTPSGQVGVPSGAAISFEDDKTA